jgi:hypothetical protein
MSAHSTSPTPDESNLNAALKPTNVLPSAASMPQPTVPTQHQPPPGGDGPAASSGGPDIAPDAATPKEGDDTSIHLPFFSDGVLASKPASESGLLPNGPITGGYLPKARELQPRVRLLGLLEEADLRANTLPEFCAHLVNNGVIGIDPLEDGISIQDAHCWLRLTPAHLAGAPGGAFRRFVDPQGRFGAGEIGLARLSLRLLWVWLSNGEFDLSDKFMKLVEPALSCASASADNLGEIVRDIYEVHEGRELDSQRRHRLLISMSATTSNRLHPKRPMLFARRSPESDQDGVARRLAARHRTEPLWPPGLVPPQRRWPTERAQPGRLCLP